MTRSKDAPYTQNHDRHVARNGADIRGTMKKNGAGQGNWGSYEDEFSFVDEDAHAPTAQSRQKLQLVDEETFQSLRQTEQNS
ncbi:hypothetical protein BC940DRAFT_289860 [Gongronella butleri]|nr:hypothetical protein BC940DRAFT_289860 [Gongronella butleri]